MVAGRDGLSRSLPSIDVATPKVRADQKVVYNPDDPDAMRVWLVHVQGLLPYLTTRTSATNTSLAAQAKGMGAPEC